MVKKFKGEIALMKKQVSIFEYILWWVVRICMIIYAIKMFKETNATAMNKALPLINNTATFGILILRMIFPQTSFFGRVSYKAQKYVSVMVFFGAFMANYFNLYSLTSRFDWVLHFISGIAITMFGYYLLLALDEDENRISPSVRACASMGFSFFIVIAWEIMEFCGDFLFGDNNQKYIFEVAPGSIMDKMSAFGKASEGQLHLYDTMFDMTLAFFTSIFTAIVIFAVCKYKNKKKAQKTAEKCPEAK